MVNILVVDDNKEIRKLMGIHLKRAGYQVFEASQGAEALDMLEHNPIHLMIVDIMMPIMDGFELTAELRGADITIPVLMISAKDTLDDKREGFRRGADDYMTKPIDMQEMLLRVEVLLRRCHISDRKLLTVGKWSLDQDTLRVQCDEKFIELRQKEFHLLHKLLSYPNKIFTRQNLMDDIWGYDSESDPRTVDTHIKRLRKKLKSIEEFDIQTVRGLGYRAVISK
ncbi:MAG: response regulator transcription factor [Oscillospiraceae bacterium]|nr:response regulator transcription factor [Oscillospiraceae bacterium]